MRLIVIVYLSFFCSLLDSTTARILDVSQNVFKKTMRLDKGQSNSTSSENTFNMLQMIREAGYPAEDHVIQTEDGYLLTMYRIPGKNGSVLLQHGILITSACFVISGKDKGLAFMLADQGYDVWMGNFRGNTYSRAHVSLSPSSPQFWNFSFHEMGVYDLPAMISYINNKTSEKSLDAYIGHSLATTAFYVMAAKYPKIAQTVRISISFSPVAFIKYLKTPLGFLTPFAESIQWFLNSLGKYEFLPHTSIFQSVCGPTGIQKEICINLMFLIVGFDREQFNITLLPAILSIFPAGTSTKTIVHFAQLHNSGKFRQYDYGRVKNLQMYNTTEPPDYNLTNIITPEALFYSTNDWLATAQDVQLLMEQLPNIVEKVLYRRFNHMDFLWAIDVPQLLYNKVFEVIEKELS